MYAVTVTRKGTVLWVKTGLFLYINFEVFTAVKIHTAIFWVMEEWYQLFKCFAIQKMVP
jgi:hypothetical protein